MSQGVSPLQAVLLCLLLLSAGCGGEEKEPEFRQPKTAEEAMALAREYMKQQQQPKQQDAPAESDAGLPSTLNAGDTSISVTNSNWVSPHRNIISMVTGIRANPEEFVERIPEWQANRAEIDPLLPALRDAFNRRTFTIVQTETSYATRCAVEVSCDPPLVPPDPRTSGVLNRLSFKRSGNCLIEMRKPRNKNRKTDPWYILPGSMIDLAHALGVETGEVGRKYSLAQTVRIMKTAVMARDDNSMRRLCTEEFWDRLQTDPSYVHTLQERFEEHNLVLLPSPHTIRDRLLGQYVRFRWVKDGEAVAEDDHLFSWSNEHGWRIHGYRAAE